jgi:hypothetical protein
MVLMTRNRFAVNRALSQMVCLSLVVDMVAAKPRATLRVGIDSSAVGVKELVFWRLSAFTTTVMLANFPAFVSTVTSVGVSPLPKSDDSGEGVFVSRGAGFGFFDVVFMFIGFAVGFFEAAKSDVFSRSDLAS